MPPASGSRARKSSRKTRVCSDEFIEDNESAPPSDEEYSDDDDADEEYTDDDDYSEQESDNPFLVSKTSLKKTRARRAPVPPSPTPSPVKNTRGVKRSTEVEEESESLDNFVPSPTTDSPKKRKMTGKNRAYVLVPTYLVSSDSPGRHSTTPPTPSPTKNMKINQQRQMVFDRAAKNIGMSNNNMTPSKKSASLLTKNTVTPTKAKGTSPSKNRTPKAVTTKAVTPKAVTPKAQPSALLSVRKPTVQQADVPKKIANPSSKVMSKTIKQVIVPADDQLSMNENDSENIESADEEEEQEDDGNETGEEVVNDNDGEEDEDAEEVMTEAEAETEDSGDQVKNTVYLEDLEETVSIPTLKKCGVYQADLVDTYLKKTYKGLPFLPKGKKITSWRKDDDAKPVQFILFSTVDAYFGDKMKINKKNLISLVTFDACKQSGYVNLSRVDPSLLVVKKPTPVYANPYICFRASAAPAKCLMFGFVHDDKTTQSFPVNGKVMKSFTIIPLSLEADRNFTVTCLLFNKNYYMTDFIRNELTFVTRMDDPDNTVSTPHSSYKKSSSSTTKVPRLAGASNSIGASNSKSSKSPASLGGRDDVPVYDARKHTLSFPESLKNMEKSLPRYNGIVPEGSFAVVCYTSVGYTKGERGARNKMQDDPNFKVSKNILWAAVLCGEDASRYSNMSKYWWWDDPFYAMMEDRCASIIY